MNIETLEILTPRLILRVPRMEDAAEVNAALNDVWRELQRWTSFAHDGENTLEATQRYIGSAQEQIVGGNLPLVAFCRESGRFAVSTGITTDEKAHSQTGYWVAKNFLRQGFATEATNAVLRFAFGAIGMPRVQITHYEGNDNSRRVIEKLGFAPIKIEPKSVRRCSDGTLLDEHYYEMTDASALPNLNVTWR